MHVTVAPHRRRPLADAQPSPPPPPRVVPHRRTIAPSHALVLPHTTTGTQARAEVLHRIAAARPKPQEFSHARPVWDLPVGGQGAGAGNKTGAGSVGNGVAGNGAGNAGSGNGAAGGNEPCGFVDFSDPHGSRSIREPAGFGWTFD